MDDHPYRTGCSLASDLSVVLQKEDFFLSFFLEKNRTQNVLGLLQQEGLRLPHSVDVHCQGCLLSTSKKSQFRWVPTQLGLIFEPQEVVYQFFKFSFIGLSSDFHRTSSDFIGLHRTFGLVASGCHVVVTWWSRGCHVGVR